MKNFKEMKIWQQGVDIAVKCYQLTAGFPSFEKFELSRQITRSGVSIPSNIAEGCSRRSEKDQSRFMEVAIGSGFELETQLIIAERVKFGDPELLKDLRISLTTELKMMVAYSQKLGYNSK